MTNDEIKALIEVIQHYAAHRLGDVARGAETPALAALMVEKFGEGIAKATRVLGIGGADELWREIDRLVRQVDPHYPTHLQYRFEARPAGLAINGAAH
jgi:hypothetical protein